jgi:threonine dehydratase
MRLSLDHIAEAARIVDTVFLHSPQFRWDWFSEQFAIDLFVKVETLNPIRSFKGRGADYFIRKLPPGVTRVVAASAGNFGQGLSYAARKRGIEVEMFAAEVASPVKLAAMRRFGARLHLAGHDFDAAKLAGKAFAREHGLPYVEDGRDPAISEGAGSMGVELAPLDLDILLVPLGNGALLGGVARWMKTHSARTRIIGVCAAGAPSMEQSWRRGDVIQTDTANTIADGIGVRVPIPEAVEDIRELMDDCMLIGDRRTRHAMSLLLQQLGLVIEGSGAIGVAAAQLMAGDWRGLKVGTILCGGNLTREQISELNV